MYKSRKDYYDKDTVQHPIRPWIRRFHRAPGRGHFRLWRRINNEDPGGLRSSCVRLVVTVYNNDSRPIADRSSVVGRRLRDRNVFGLQPPTRLGFELQQQFVT